MAQSLTVPPALTNIVAQFAKLKPALIADYTRYITTKHAHLLELYSGPTGPADMYRHLLHAFGANAKAYRLVLGHCKTPRDKFELDADHVARRGQQYANEQIDKFTYKLLRKLGDLTEASIDDIDVNGFQFQIHGRLGTKVIRVDQSRIINVSPRGALFHQWPARIYVDGKFTSERAYKAMVAEAV